MTCDPSKLFIGIKDNNLVIFDHFKPLCLINKLIIFGLSRNGYEITLKLPYANLIFTPHGKDESVGKHIYNEYLFDQEKITSVIYTLKPQSTLSSDFIDKTTDSKYQVLADGSSASTRYSFGLFISNNLDFKLKNLVLKYKMGKYNYKYHLLTYENLENTDYENNSNNPLFFETSITWCGQNNNDKCVLICSSHLSILPREIKNSESTIRENKFSLTKRILGDFLSQDASNNIWFYSTNFNEKNKNTDTTFTYAKIDRKKFTAVLASLNSALGIYDSYFSSILCRYLEQWLILAFKCSQYLSMGNNVVIEDTDNTPVSFIIGSLSKILIDPKYCTFDGFIGLIRDDWINRGYFYILGDKKTIKKDKEKLLKDRLNYFYAWLTCVQFLLFKYPLKFEFTYWTIYYISNNLWTQCFYPFSYSCSDGDIFARLIESKDKLINYAYHLKKSSEIYSELAEEIKNIQVLQKNKSEERLGSILGLSLSQFKPKTTTINLNNYYLINSSFNSIYYFINQQTFNFFLSLFYDPGAAAYHPPIQLTPSNITDNKETAKTNEVVIIENEIKSDQTMQTQF